MAEDAEIVIQQTAAFPQLAIGGGLNIPWAAYAGKGQFTAPDGSWSMANARQVLPILIKEENNNLEGYQAILGRHEVNGNELVRVSPWQHPKFPKLYAVDISGIKGMGPIGIEEGKPKHKLVMLTVVFSNVPWKIKDEVEDESQRWVIKRMRSTTQYLQRDRGQYRFMSGVKDGAIDWSTQPFEQGPALLVQKSLLEWTWKYVPESFVCDANAQPTNILRCVGKVNKNSFAGYGPGELLMKDPNVEPVPSPVCDENLVDVTIVMEGLKVPVIAMAEGPGNVLGHQCCPLPGDSKGRWGPVESQPEGKYPGGALLYREADFSIVFKKIGAEES